MAKPKLSVLLAGIGAVLTASLSASALWAADQPLWGQRYSRNMVSGEIRLPQDFDLSTGRNVKWSVPLGPVPAPKAPSLVVLDKTTGRLVATDNESIGSQIIHCTWSSPSVGEVAGRPLVFFAGGDAVCYGFDAWPADSVSATPGTLHRVWRFDCDPAAPKKNVHKFQDNRRKGPSHISGMPVFVDGRILVTVGGDIWHGKREAWLKCFDATQTGEVGVEGEIWSYPLERHGVSTPAIHKGLVYATDCGGNAHCVDAKTGEPCWTHRAGGEIWSSPLVADGKVYVGTRRKELWVYAAGREKQVLHSAKFDDPINATPVAANGVLYVTTMSRLYALHRSTE